MTYADTVSALALVAAGIALMIISQRRDWRPSLAVALVVAVALRVGMLALTHRVRPYDLTYDFRAAAVAVLHHQDPILNNRSNGWASLPVYAFVLAGAEWTYLHLHFSWLVIARIPAILCDLGVVVLVGKLAGITGERGALRRFQYACNPVAILVSSVHGQLEPACLLLVCAAFVVVLRGGPGLSGRRAVGGGLLLGLAVATQTWPVLFGPALLIALPSWRRRIQATAAAAALGAVIFVTMPLTVGTPWDKLWYLAKHMINNHPTIGTWGWAGVWVTQHPTAQPVWSDPLWLNVAKVGTKLALAAALLAVFWWRRGHPLDVATATTTALIVVTPAFGNQYLQWPVPTSTARPNRLSLPLQIVLGIYAAVFYLPLNQLTGSTWQSADNVMMFISLGVMVFLVAALPWRRRVWNRPVLPAGSMADAMADAMGGPVDSTADEEPALATPVPDHLADEVLAESVLDTIQLPEGQTNMPN
jgi:hypothetical protein